MTEMEGRTLELRDQAADAADTVQQKASEMKDQALEKGGQTLRSQADERSSQLGRQAQQLAHVLRRSSTELRSQNGDGTAARLTTQAADRLERAGTYLVRARGDDIVRDAERFARRMPWLVAGAAAAAGFAASRFLKASAEGRYDAASDRERAWQPPRVDEQVSSSRYPSPPTVTVGTTEAIPAR